MAGPIRLFSIGQRGVDVVNKPQDLDESELVSGQNCEIATSGGGGALDQRPGMTRIGSTPLGGAAIMILDVASQLLTDLTAWLYAGLYSTATHNWRASSDGATWVNDDTPAKPASDTLAPAVTASVSSLIVGGGGGGGATGGGGGGGAVIANTDAMAVGAFAVVVGTGGPGGTALGDGTVGVASTFNGHTAGGGGFGAGNSGSTNGGNGANGSSGGGARSSSVAGTGGTGSSPGNTGGSNGTVSLFGAGGGGGGSQVGGNGTTTVGGKGGDGTTSSITGSPVVYGGGGGGGIQGSATPGAGGTGGGGAGTGDNTTATTGTANLGGGGGGGGFLAASGSGGAGGLGVVIISYATGVLTATGGSMSTSGGNTIHTFNGSGTFTITALASIAVKDFTPAARIGKYLYFVDANNPIQIHQWDGVSDIAMAAIPPAVSGTTLGTPGNQAFDWAFNGTAGATSYTYKLVAINGASHSAVSVANTVSSAAATLNSSNYNVFSPFGSELTPVAGAASYDVYRTAGGSTQGKIGSIPISAGVFSRNNGSGVTGNFIFSDAGLTGDGTSPPSSASGASAGGAIAVLDLITDGTSLYLAVLDTNNGGSSSGRILQFTPSNRGWLQILGEFPLVAAQGAPGSLAFYDGALNYGTYIASDTGKSAAVSTTNMPLPAGGVVESHTTAANVVPTAMVGFQGNIYVATAFITSGTAAVVLKRLPPTGTWSTARTGPGTAAYNAYTSLGVFNGRLFAGWTSGDGTTAARIESTPDGVNWTLEFTAATTEFPCQMQEFNSKLYVVLGRTGAIYNTTSRIVQRTAAGTWTEVDNPTDDFCGCLAVVYK